MAINVNLGDVAQPQRLDALAFRQDGNPAVIADHRRLIVYTGWIGATFGPADNDLGHTDVLSFVPNSDGTVQTFGEDNQDLGAIQAVVMASLSSFDQPATAAVDHASVAMKHQEFQGVAGPQRILVIKAHLSLSGLGGYIHGIAYQVTVLSHPSQLVQTLTLPKSVNPSTAI